MSKHPSAAPRCARSVLNFAAAIALAVAFVQTRGTAQSGGPIQTVFVIVMENHNWSDIVGSPSAPFINSLLPKASRAEQYYTPPGIRPSTPNYLWMEAGQDFGLSGRSGYTPSRDHQSTANHLVTQLQNAGISWKTYQEDISGTQCPLADQNLYAVRHNPFVFFDDVTNTNDPNSAYCLAHVRPYSELTADLAQNRVVRYNFITPNLCNDMHDCGVSGGDTWLSTELPNILNSPAYVNGGVVFITWDEGTGSVSDGPIGMIALSPAGKGNGYFNSIPYTHSSLLLTLQEIFGVRPLLGDAANATDLSDLFVSFPVVAPSTPNPTDGAIGISTTVSLRWSSSGSADDVYLGVSNPPSLVASGVTTHSYTPPTLSAGTTYFWRVVARNAGGATSPVWSFTTASAPSSGNVVIYASDIPSNAIHGVWTFASDSTSPNGLKLATPDRGWATTTVPLASPADYVDATFNAVAGTPYTIWLRLQATGNSKPNDSVWVQFSDAQANGSSVYPVNTTSALLVNLATDSTGASLNGWGWYNGAYWLSQATTVTFSTSGPHTLRIQVREDGVEFDQVVLSPGTYLNTAPGPPTADSTIVPKPNKDQPPATPGSPSPPNGATGVSTGATLSWSAPGATSYDVRFGTTNPPPLVVSGQTATSYAPAMTAGAGHFWQIVARNSVGTSAGPIWSFSTAVVTTTHPEIVIYAGEIPSAALHGSWSVATDPTSPNGLKLVTADAGWATPSNPLASPTDYIDATFTADANTSYTLWLRIKAVNNNKYNDSVWAQFSDAQAGGSQLYPMNTTSGLLVNLATDVSASSLGNWGWQNGAYWLAQPATVMFPTTGTHTMRIQVREDGVQFDQIVLSSARYLTAAPGTVSNDGTIVPKP